MAETNKTQDRQCLAEEAGGLEDAASPACLAGCPGMEGEQDL